MPTILITGASSGIGLAFLRAYATATTTNTIITCDMIPLPPSSSSSYLPPNNRITHHILDITSSSSISAFTSSIRQTPIDLIIHSIGIRGLVKSLHTSQPGSASAAETLDAMDLETLTTTFAVNAAGAFMLFRELVPNLLLSTATQGGASSQQQPKVVVMSSRMGSIAANHGGGGYAYRASKAALNAMVKSLSVDVSGVTWVLCHPGRVESNLVRYKEEGAISADESVSGLLPLIESWGKEDSGRFYDRFGEKIEW